MKHNPSIIHFGAGPAALPKEVLNEAAQSILNYNNTGLSILEIPHRGKLFEAILSESKSLVLELTKLSADEYEVLWLQGGGRMQFAMLPMNFLAKDATAGYIDSGFWANDAQKHAAFYGNVLVLASSQNEKHKSVPALPKSISDDLAYVHFTSNNTIYGTQIKTLPNTSVPLIADMSSDIFSEERDYSPYSLFYAVAQKNIGPAGVTLVVVRKSMLAKIVRKLPPILDYSQHATKNSVLNTPPVFSIYTSLLNLRWLKAKGIAQIAKANKEKAALLYQEIDRNQLFEGRANRNNRSDMNIVFEGINTGIERDFIDYCRANAVEGIEGHRTLGGLRVSLYNAISIAQTQCLVALMQNFEHENLNK